MKHPLFVVLPAVAFTFLTGCGRSENKATETTAEASIVAETQVAPSPVEMPSVAPAAGVSAPVVADSPETPAVALQIPYTGYRPESVRLDDDAKLWTALDLERPELAAVKAAVAAGDQAGAVKALAAHLRTRTAPVLVFEGKRVEPAKIAAPSNRRLGANSPAEKIVAKDFTIAGISHKFNGPINWRLNPTTRPGYEGGYSSQFHTQLSRGHIWITLLNAWQETGNPFYLRAWIDQLEHWRGQNPPPDGAEVATHVNEYRAGGGAIKGFPLYLPLDSGTRSTNLTRAFELTRQSADITDRELVDLVKLLAEHARLIAVMPIGDNHLAIATGGLGAVAAMFPEFKEASAWQAEALKRADVELGKQVYPDGAQSELTPWYHHTTFKQFANVVEMARVNGAKIAPATITALGRMIEHTLRISQPDGVAPALNDSEYLGVDGVAQRGLDFFPERADFRFFASKGAEGAAPAETSLLQPWAGAAVMRSGWDAEALYLLTEYGQLGTGHMHEDKLGLVVNAYGRRILVDTGRSAYEVNVWRDYMMGPSAHSTVLVDGLGQQRRLDRAVNSPRVLEPAPVDWSTGTDYDYVGAAYGEMESEKFASILNPPGQPSPFRAQLEIDAAQRGAPPAEPLTAGHRRHVVFVKPHYWVIVDVLTPAVPEGAHTYTSLFHFGPGETRSGQGAVVFGETGRAGAVLAAAPGAAESLEVVRGQEKPFILGWQFSKSGAEKTPIPVAVYKRQGTGVVANGYALIPHAAGKTATQPELSWNVTKAGADTFALRVDPKNGAPVVTVLVPRATGGGVSWAGERLEVPAAVVGADGVANGLGK